MATESISVQTSIVEETPQEECSICVESFTTNERKPITCPKCQVIICKKCVQTFLKSISDEPYCMNCKFGWDNSFLFKNINKTFINTELKKAKTLRTFETEKARFPETMAELEQFNEHKKIVNEKDTIIKENELVHEQITKLEQELNILKNQRYMYNQQLDDIHYICENENNPLRVNQYFRNASKKTDTTTVKREFKHPCPAEDCNGIMGRNWTCPVCETHACSKCFENLGKNLNEIEHECKQDNLKSAEEIRKNTRACPKCAVPIFKISGCDQMWCTQCQVGFSWTSGKIVRGNRIHNPHYFQALQAGNINVARNPGDQICGGIPYAHNISSKFRSFSRILINGYYKHKRSYNDYRIMVHKTLPNGGRPIELSPTDLYSFLLYITRIFNHNEYTIIDRLRGQIQTNTDNSDIRMKFITKRISEADFKRNLCTRNTKRYKIHELLQIIELFHTVCTDNIQSIYNIEFKDYEHNAEHIKDVIMNTFIKNIQQIRTYCNEQFDLFHKNNNLTSYYITDLFEIVSSSDKDNRIQKGY